MRAAIIGSFRQHYEQVRATVLALRAEGIEITTPKGADVLEAGIPFVRFDSDPVDWDDATVQTIALHRILRADAVYVVAPNGYVGRTTCYEIGRVMQANRPIYFSEQPDDLPIAVPELMVVTATRFAALVRSGEAVPMFATSTSDHAVLEHRLIVGEYAND